MQLSDFLAPMGRRYEILLSVSNNLAIFLLQVVADEAPAATVPPAPRTIPNITPEERQINPNILMPPASKNT